MPRSQAEIAEEVIAIVARQAMLPSAEVALSATPQSLGLDSLGLVETIFAIEETFDISVPFNANDPSLGQFDISSIAAIIAAVAVLIAAKPA